MIVSYGDKASDITTPCFSIQTPDLKYYGYIGYSGANFSPENTILNDVSITRVSVQNTIEKNYADAKSSKERTIRFNQKEANDILKEHHQKMLHEESEKKNILSIKQEESDEEILVKFYEA